MAAPQLQFLLFGLCFFQRVCTLTIWDVGDTQADVEARDDLPTPEELYKKYMKPSDGPFKNVGKPVLLRGAAKAMPAFTLWTDDYLRDTHGKVKMDQVETEKHETRTKMPHDNWDLAKFLSKYNSSTLYSVATTPEGLNKEVYLLPSLNCGGYHSQLSATVLWFSSGGTRSVIHNDGQQNIHCMIAGEKRWKFWRPDSKIDTKAGGWMDAEKEDKKGNPKFKNAYGVYAGLINVDNVDVDKFPLYQKIHSWEMTLRAGDCAFIPQRWFHYVEAPKQRAISFHIWFHSSPKGYIAEGCAKMTAAGYDTTAYLLRVGDCTFDEEGKKKTKCSVRKEMKQSKPAASTDEL